MEQGSKTIIAINEPLVKAQLGEVVRETVEETLNKLLDAEADALCNAQRYQRSAERTDTGAGSYERNLETKAGTVRLKIPKLRKLPFESSIIERYKRRECSVEEALMEMYLADVSVMSAPTMDFLQTPTRRFPRTHWRSLRTNNPMERMMREIRRRTKMRERSLTLSSRRQVETMLALPY